MPRRRHTPRSMPAVEEIPFASSEEAWFWYIRAERLRRDGARPSRGAGTVQRPCEPDDMNRFVIALLNKKTIHHEHIKVLATFGWKDRAPDPRVREEERAAMLWDDALDRLSTELKTRGIVE